jgi:hypothetical protein
MEVKGTAVATIPLFVKQQHGDNAFRQWLDTLTPEARDTLGDSVLPSVWYPMREILVEPTRAICDLFYDGDNVGAVELGRFSAKVGLSGVYRLFVRISSPEFIIARASQILPTYYRPSSMIVAEKGPGYAVIRVTEFPEPDTLVEHRIMGWMKHALQICGVKSEEIRIAESLTEGAPHTEFHVNWI